MKNSLLSLVFLIVLYPVFAQDQKPYSATFISLFAGDTVAVETYTRYDHYLTGKAIIRIPDLHIRNFHITFKQDGSIEKLYLTMEDPVNPSLPFKSRYGYRVLQSLHFEGDSLVSRFYPGEQVSRFKSEDISFLGGWSPIMSLVEWNCRRLKASGKNEINSNMVNTYLGVHGFSLKEISPDSILVRGDLFRHMRVKVDQEGQVEAIDGSGSAWNYKTSRHPPLDIYELIEHFRGKPALGDPSPPGRLVREIDGTPITITYGRPFKRGREIFGNIVPYDTIWRTGAGPCTRIQFEKAIIFNKTTIPPGDYCLYTIPSQDQWTLIFNTNLNQWPTNPDHTRHVAELPMKVSRLENAVDQLTFEIRKEQQQHVLHIRWDDMDAFVPFQIK
ncbi:MAG: DUF2911 domain-containing protein [Candidatus Cyclobacteriaceae bacterium M3_2C_046]